MTGCRTECVHEGNAKRNRETERPGYTIKARMKHTGCVYGRKRKAFPFENARAISITAAIIDDNTGRLSDCHANHGDASRPPLIDFAQCQ